MQTVLYWSTEQQVIAWSC